MIIVGIGASAGGMEAICEFLECLPPNTGASYVIVQHLSPDTKSIMDELYKKHTSMKVRMLNKDVHPESNCIYLLPGDKSLSFEYGLLKVRERDSATPIHLPIDHFFHSLGAFQKEKAIAVIFSGSGTDGSRGVRTIKEHGGLVMVQSPESAKFDGMPNAAILSETADIVLPPKKLALKLDHILKVKRIKGNGLQLLNLDESEHKTNFNKIISIVSQASDINFSGYREKTLVRRTEKRMLLQQCSTLEDYIKVLNKDEHEVEALYKDFLIGVTHFFRDPAAFEEINKLIPNLFTNLSPNETCRIWVPACSTGEEAYTIGALVMEYLKNTNQTNLKFKIFATDVNTQAINFAYEGLYPMSVGAEIPKIVLQNWFLREGEFFRVKKELREKILFAAQDLLSDPPFINTKLISCRNLLIYLKAKAQIKILASFHFALRPGGYLMIGPSESLGNLKHAYNLVNRRWNIFERKGDGPALTKGEFAKLSSPAYYIKQHKSNMNTPQYENIPFKHDLSDPFTQYLVESFAPVSLFINEQLDILYINGDIERILKLPKALARLNLHKMIDKKSLQVFKNGTQKALDSNFENIYNNIIFNKEDKKTEANLRFKQVSLPEVKGPVVLVEIHIIGEPAKSKRKEGDVKLVSKEVFLNDQLQTLERELMKKDKEMKQLVGEIEAANEELQASNRELLASNEELQSTNEELQSVNEELYTVNTELQAKNEELSIANSDINNLLVSTEIGTIFLDKDLRIRKFTPAVKQQFDLLPSDIGRPITAFSTTLENFDLGEQAIEVFKTLKPFEDEISDVKGRRFFMRILPYRTEDDVIDGLVISFIDVEEIVKAKDSLSSLANRFEAIFRNSEDAILFLDRAGEVNMINKPLGGYSVKRLKGSNIYEELQAEPAKILKNTVRKVFRANKSKKITLTLKKGDENYYWYTVCVIPVAEKTSNGDSPDLVALIANDITAQHEEVLELEQALKTYQEFMKNAVHHQITLIDKDGIIIDLNYAKHTGKSVDELVGTSIYQYLPADQIPEYKKAVKGIFNGESYSKIEYDFVDKDNNRLEVTVTATPVIFNKDVKYVALMGERIK